MTVFTICVGCALLAIASRRRSLALALVTLQSLLLAGLAFWHVYADDVAVTPASALAARAVAIAVILGIAIRRTHETRLIRSEIEPLVRIAIALVMMLVVPVLLPVLIHGHVAEQRAAMALVVLGIVMALTRRDTIMQLLGIIIAENGATALALINAVAVPIVIELGVVFDLLLIAIVAVAFNARIFRHFGSSDTAHLQGLHD